MARRTEPYATPAAYSVGAEPGRDQLDRLIDAAFAAQQDGRMAEAERLCRRVLAIRPRQFEGLHLLGVVSGHTGRRALGIKLIRQALRVKPNAPDAMSHLANLLKEEGKVGEAMDLYRRAIEIMPNYAAAHNNLGLLQLSEDRCEDAVACFTRALQLSPSFANAQFHLGEALDAKGAHRQANAAYQRALTLAPNGGSAPHWVGTILTRLGRFEEALDYYTGVLAADPRQVHAYYGFVSAKKITSVDRPLVSRMEALAAERGMDEGQRALLGFALGKAFDDLADYPRAIQHFDEANRAALRQLKRMGKTFDRKQHALFIDRLIATFTPEFFASRAMLGSGSQLPVLIVGMPRSGTTLVEQILSSHPEIGGGGELRFWGDRVTALGRSGAAELGALVSQKLADDYLALLSDIAPTALRVTDKMPGNFQNIGLAHLIFPCARIIHCRRNPIDTGLSIYFTLFASPMTYCHDRGNIVAFYEEYLRLMAHWRGVLPADCLLEVDYEAVVADRESEARRMIAFLGLDWDRACLQHENNARSVMTASMWQARQPIYQGSVERWRRYEPWLGVFSGLLPQVANKRAR